jgi:hypothetical protein
MDGLTIQPPSALTSAGGDWRYCPYGNGIDVGHNWIFGGIGFNDDDDGGEDGQVGFTNRNLLIEFNNY